MKRIAIAGIAFLGLTAGCDAPSATGPDETTLATDVVEAATTEIVVPITLGCSGAHSQFAALPDLALLTDITLTATAAPVVTRRWSTSLIDDGPGQIGAIIFDGTRFLATGGDGSCGLCNPFAAVWESTDGGSWHEIVRIDGVPYWSDMIHTGLRYVAGGYGSPGRIWVSEDGATWTPEPGGASYWVPGPRSFAWDGDRTVVVLGSLRPGYSVDGGATFTANSQVLFDNAWYGHGVIWDGHQFIAYFGVPYGHPDYPGTMIATSPDGIQWTEHHTHQSALPMILIWMATDGAGRFLAFDNLNRKAMSSGDGLHWTPAPASVPRGPYGYEAGEFLSYHGRIYSSADGLDWHEECTGGGLYYDLASGNGRRVVVGIPSYRPGGTPIIAAVSDLTVQPYAELSLQVRTNAPTTRTVLTRQLLRPTDARDPRFSAGSTTDFAAFIASRVLDFIMPIDAAAESAVSAGAFEVRVRYRQIGGG